MNLYALKPGFVRSLGRITTTAADRGITPDQVTAAGMILGAAAGAAVAVGTVTPLALLAVPPLVLARLAANAIDGQLARGHDQATPRGAVTNELADRIGDLATLAPLALVAPVTTAVLLVGLITAEWAATLDWAVHGTRRFVGPFGKPDRMVLLAVGAVAAMAWPVALPVTAAVLAAGVWIAAVARIHAALVVGR